MKKDHKKVSKMKEYENEVENIGKKTSVVTPQPKLTPKKTQKKQTPEKGDKSSHKKKEMKKSSKGSKGSKGSKTNTLLDNINPVIELVQSVLENAEIGKETKKRKISEVSATKSSQKKKRVVKDDDQVKSSTKKKKSESGITQPIKAKKSDSADLNTTTPKKSKTKKESVKLKTPKSVQANGSATKSKSKAKTSKAPSSSNATQGREKNSVTVRVPATSANLGSGYDCLGFALDMWTTITVSRSDKFELTAEGEGAEKIPLDKTNLVVVGLKKAFDHVKKEMPPLKIHMNLEIPFARGLGSSSAAIVGGLVAGLALAGHTLDVQGKESLLQLATEIETHPDNVAPAMYGGLQLGIYNERLKRWSTERIPLPHGLVFVAFIPEVTGTTEELRKVVPKTVPIQDAVFNMSRLAWLVHALLTSNFENVREGMEDRLHQNQRGKVESHQHVLPMIDAAYKAGAIGAYLSGSGPVVMAITRGGFGDFFVQNPSQRSDTQVAKAMQKVADELKLKGHVYVTHPSQTGGVIVKADPPFSTELLKFNGST